METFGPVSPACRVPALGEICGVLGLEEPGADGVDGGGLVGVGFVEVGVVGPGEDGVPGVVEVGGAGVPGGVVVEVGGAGVSGVVETGDVTGVLGAGLVGGSGVFDGSPGAELAGVPGPDGALVGVVVPGAVLCVPGGAAVVCRPGFDVECVPPPSVVASSGEVAGSVLAPWFEPEVEPS